MNKPPYPVSPRSAVTSTMMSASQVTSTLKLADNLRDDPDKDKRLAAHRCLPCHYIVRLAGQAFTQQPCGICLVDQTYPSTSTDVLCLPCASARELCKHCGGDLHLRTDRRKWWQVADPEGSQGE